MKILHVVGELQPGGVESWLLSLVRKIDRERFHLDFLVHTSAPGAYDGAVRALGSRVLPSDPSRPWSYAHRVGAVMREHGPYDAVHSHVHHFSGFVLRLARSAGVPARIVHSHSDTSRLDHGANPLRRIYLRRMHAWIDRYATCGIAASRRAAEALYGAGWKRDPRWRVLYCGVDLDAFRIDVHRQDVRRELGIPDDAWVIGHVGSFSRPKNHPFLIQVCAEVLRRVPQTVVLLIGEGPSKASIEQEIRRRGLSQRVICCGARNDVPRIMLGALDLFVFPSLWEGLPLGLIEAQAAGLPCLISDVVTTEADVVPSLITRLSLARPSDWVEAILQSPHRAPGCTRTQAATMVETSAFNAESSAHEMEKLYASL